MSEENLEQNSIPHLCGGTLFALLLQAKRTSNKKAKEKLMVGGTDKLADEDLLAGLIKLMTGEEDISRGGTLKKCATLYKTCQKCSSGYIPFTDRTAVSAFDKLVKDENPEVYTRMMDFVDTYLAPGKLNWLVQALIETITDDNSIPDDASFYIDYSKTEARRSIKNIRSVTLQPFLVSVLDYVVLNAPDSESGRPTFESWFKQEKKQTEWKYCGHVGDKIGEIEVNLADYEPDSDDSFSEDDETLDKIPLVVESVAPDLDTILDAGIYMGEKEIFDFGDEDDDIDIEPLPFEKYLNGAVEYYKDKKILLNREVPRKFYDIYVCNDLAFHNPYASGAEDEGIETISDGTVQLLEKKSKYLIIEGTGGMGKSMYLTHLFLSSAKQYMETGRLPVLILLKDYKRETIGTIEFIWHAVKAYDQSITKNQIIKMLEDKKMILLLDGMDEIKSSLRDNFYMDLEGLIKAYSGNTIIMTSRPISSFIAYAKFSLLDIQPLTEEQAVSLLDKIEFWDNTAKQDLIEALKNGLYDSHKQFASNPLLLTILLMTYSSFGEIPGKMHVFYSMAYNTMARFHDKTKGLTRPMHTNLTPEEFAKYFSQFCARTYVEEKLEFTDRLFSVYMDKVLRGTDAKAAGVTSRDFIEDLTDNLCIMYKEGETYYFIHRSFQEYFAAVFFANDYESKLEQLGDYFDEKNNRTYTDRTFDMLYDMIPGKVERFIFLPYLRKMFNKDERNMGDEYWRFLLCQYPTLVHQEGETCVYIPTLPRSYVYQKMIIEKNLFSSVDLDKITWPEQVHHLEKANWVKVYREFMDEDAYERYPDPLRIPEEILNITDLDAEEAVPDKYIEYFGKPEVVGETINVEVEELLKDQMHYKPLIDFMEQDSFPLMEEFKKVKAYFAHLQKWDEQERKSKRLFDD